MLRFFAQLVLWRGEPTIIGVTGVQGKTATKAAIAAILLARGKSVRTTLQNVQDESAVYRAILGCVRRKGKGGMFCILRSVFSYLFGLRRYPPFLVVEMTPRIPGLVAHLAALVRPTIGVCTLLSDSTVSEPRKAEKAEREMNVLLASVDGNGWVIINGDDARLVEMKPRMRARVLTFGFGKGVDVRGTELLTNQDIDEEGIPIVRGVSFKISYKGSVVPVFLSGALGEQHVLAALAGAAVGLAHHLNLVEISTALKSYVPPGGRLRVIPGIKKTVILDDTYNGSALASENAIAALASVPVREGNHRFAIFGDCTDTFEKSEELHARLGSFLPEKKIHWLVTIGEKARDIDRGARKAGMDDSMIAHFRTAEEAGRFVQEKLKKGDAVLVKGDPTLHMERIVKELMAEPLKACDLLVRQDDDWECR